MFTIVTMNIQNNPATRRQYAGLPDSYYPKSFILYLAGTYPLFITIF